MYITPVINQSPSVSRDANIDNYCFMENREQQILSEIKSMVASIRNQLEMLDAKMVEFHQAVDPEGFKTESINVIIDDIGMLAPHVDTEVVEEIPLDIPEDDAEEILMPEEPAEEVQEEVVEPKVDEEQAVESEAEEADETEPEAGDLEMYESELEEVTPEQADADDDDLPFGDPVEESVEELPAESDDLPEDVNMESSEPAEELKEEAKEEVKEEVKEEEEDDDLPGFFDVPEVVTVAVKAAGAARPTINDAHSTDQAWRKDMPGSPVRDIRSAISLNDRVFFINNLFEEDAQAFVNALSNINTMTTLDEVVEYVTAQYPHWNLNSDVVYRFMMAVRRKVNS